MGSVEGMEFLGKNKNVAGPANMDGLLYSALAAGDLPAAWLITKPLVERAKTEQFSYATEYNCGLCFYQLEEYERTLSELKRAEQLVSNEPDFDIAERKLFLQALSKKGKMVVFLPLNPESSPNRYALIRIRWLMALSLIHLERKQEAAPIIRFLSQYNIEI